MSFFPYLLMLASAIALGVHLYRRARRQHCAEIQRILSSTNTRRHCPIKEAEIVARIRAQVERYEAENAVGTPAQFDLNHRDRLVKTGLSTPGLEVKVIPIDPTLGQDLKLVPVDDNELSRFR